ncbi:MAG: hypothetical protein M3O09_15310 [Acidobacteriota bacterium]|nr:hypothetical protein [Acidobacteriota bacterium]
MSKKGLSRRDSLAGTLAERETRGLRLDFAEDFFAAVFLEVVFFVTIVLATLVFATLFFLFLGASFFPALFFTAVRFLPELAFVSFFLAFFLAISGSLPLLHTLHSAWQEEITVPTVMQLLSQLLLRLRCF